MGLKELFRDLKKQEGRSLRPRKTRALRRRLLAEITSDKRTQSEEESKKHSNKNE